MKVIEHLIIMTEDYHLIDGNPSFYRFIPEFIKRDEIIIKQIRSNLFKVSSPDSIHKFYFYYPEDTKHLKEFLDRNKEQFKTLCFLITSFNQEIMTFIQVFLPLPEFRMKTVIIELINNNIEPVAYSNAHQMIENIRECFYLIQKKNDSRFTPKSIVISKFDATFESYKAYINQMYRKIYGYPENYEED